MVRWLRWHCPPDTGFEIRALAVWGRARYLSVTEAPHNTNFHTWMGKKQFCFFQTAETGNRTPDSGVKGSCANHYPRAPAQFTRRHYINHTGPGILPTGKSWNDRNNVIIVRFTINMSNTQLTPGIKLSGGWRCDANISKHKASTQC